jgi:TetR/AcrR family transcriptional regulator
MFNTKDNPSNPARRKPGRRPTDAGSADDTRREIVERAMLLFHTRGFGAVSVDDVAEAAGVTKPTLYYHFSGKGEIYTHGVAHMAERMHANITRIAALPGQTVYQRLRRMLEERREILNTQPVIAWNEAMMEETMAHLSAEQQRRIKASISVIHVPLRGLMAEGIASGELRAGTDPDVLAVAFRQLVQPTTYHFLPDHDGARLDFALLDLFYRGAATRGDAPTTTPGGGTNEL